MSERAVVVGAGGISGAWFPQLIAEGVKVEAVVDLSAKTAEARIKEYALDAKPSNNLKKTLKKFSPDFVVDLTIPEAHCDVTCTALNMDCHVIGEKPMASSMSEARKMVRTAEKSGKTYMVSQSRRWDARHEQVRLTLESGSVGQIGNIVCEFFIGAHFGGFRDEMRSPLILDMAIHHFDLVRFMTGLDPVAVYAREFNPAGSWYRGDAAASCIFEMSNDVIFTYTGSWCAEGFNTSWNGDWRIMGDKGTLRYIADDDPSIEVVAGEEGFTRPLRSTSAVPSQTDAAKTGMRGALCEMLDFIREGKTPQTECHDNIKSLAMVFAAIESSRKGKRVPVQW